MKSLIVAMIFVFLLTSPVPVPGQVINATLSGTVTDATGALVPGVGITARNTDTGVASTNVTNESGTYFFGSLQPGPYEVSAALPGFQTQTIRLSLGTSQQIRQNFTLQVGAVTQNVDVSIAPDQLLTTVTSSVGNVLLERQVVDLPLVGRNVMDFATIMPGVIGNGGATTTFAGIQANGSGNVNLQLDGVTVNNGRHAQGLAAATTITPDIVEEVRVVVAAVDVEGRGSAQIQVRTRSGTNQYHGSAVWNIRNSALNANTWSNNRQGIDQTWYNRHQYTATFGGPIIRNKTFFFGFFDGQNGSQKQTVSAVVLTDPARQGIFRFFPGVNNGNADVNPNGSGSGNTRVAPVVDQLGNPRDWTQIPGATGPMQSFNVFGDSLNPGDPNRSQMDPSGFMQRLLTYMPRANAFDGPSTVGGVAVDGLNTAIHRWTRRTIAGGTISGENPDTFRRHQYSIKIDHNFNSRHKLTGSWTDEHRYTDNNAQSPWPTGWDGELITDPSVKTVTLTSTLSPTLLNEFRFGRRVTTLHSIPAYHASEGGEEAFNFMTVINGIPVMQHPTLFQDHAIACAGYCADFGNKSPLSTFTETLSWVRGAHALKFGGEFRFASTFGWAPNVVIPHAYGGAGDVAVQGIDQIRNAEPGFLANGPNQQLAQNLLLSLSGSVNDTRERFEIREPTDTRFLDFRDTYFNPANPEGTYGRIRDWHQNEFNAFIKDDWKITPTLTLNLGVRYDLMRVPYLLSAEGKGFTPGLIGGNNAIFGYSGRSFNDWMSGGTPQRGELTQTTLIGRGTNFPDQGMWPTDTNNIAPAVGFAWSPNWFGQDKTTIRGGYQIAYQLPGNSLSWVDVDGGNLPGFFYEPTDRGDGTFRDFSNMTIPLAVTQMPFDTIPITQRSQNTAIFDANYVTPYVQNFTLGVTRALTSSVTLDVRYVGTRGVKLAGSYNLNDAEIRRNGLFDALLLTRNGGDAPVFDTMLNGLNFGTGIGVVGTNGITGSEALRRHSFFRTNIANGDFVAVARTLSTTNLGTVQPPLTNAGLLRYSGAFPANFIVTNPQFANITYRTNSDSSNYHSLQTQVTLHPTSGIQYQATYTWSRSMGVDSAGSAGLGVFRDLQNRNADYALLSSNRSHDFRSYGTFELPFGPGKLIGGNTSNWIARVIEGWKLGTIFNLTSGAPLNIVAVNSLYGLGTPNVVGDFSRDGEVVWPLNSGDTFGNYFPQGYRRERDPQCIALATQSLRDNCTLNVIRDASGNIVLRNAAPGEMGTLGLRPIEGPGTIALDANLQKTVTVGEGRSITFRVDANNVLNHPNAGAPNLNMSSGTFGEINTKTGSRSLQALVRFDF